MPTYRIPMALHAFAFLGIIGNIEVEAAKAKCMITSEESKNLPVSKVVFHSPGTRQRIRRKMERS